MELREEVKKTDDIEARNIIIQRFVDYATTEEIKSPYNKVTVSEAFTSWWAFLSVTERLWGIQYTPTTGSEEIVAALKSSDSTQIYNEVVKELIKTSGADEFFAGVMVARGFRILSLASPVVGLEVSELGNVDSEVILLSDHDGVRLWGALVQRETDEVETPGDLPA